MDNLFEGQEAIEKCKDLLDGIISDISDLITLYHGDDKKIAFKSTDTFTLKIIDLMSNLKISGALEMSEIKKIEPILAELIHSLENVDYVLISDLLEYELLPLMSSWRHKIIIRIANTKQFNTGLGI